MCLAGNGFERRDRLAEMSLFELRHAQIECDLRLLRAETQGLAILSRSGLKLPLLGQRDTQVAMNGRVIRRAHLQLAP